MKNTLRLTLGLLMMVSAPAWAAGTLQAPTSSWLVGPATMDSGPAGAGIPCIVTNQFANGTSFRLSGGGGKLLAMAVGVNGGDYRRGSKYDVELNAPGEFFQIVSATAYDERTLLLKLKDIPDLYPALRKAKTLSMKVDGGTADEYALLGLGEGFDRMETCFGGGAATSHATATPTQNPGVFEIKSGKERSDNFVMPAGSAPPPAMPVSAASGQSSSALTPLPGDDAAVAAMDADSIEALLNRAATDNAKSQAKAAGLLAQAKASQDKAKDLSDKGIAPPQVSPKTPPAAAIPLQRTAETKAEDDKTKTVSHGTQLARSWSDPTVHRKNVGNIITGVPASRMAGGEESAPEKTAVSAGRRWSAAEGDDLRTTVERWAESENIRVVWMSGRAYAVQKSVSFQGPMNGALLRLLDQFNGESERPVGKVYNDPAAGGRVLVVQTDRSWRDATP